MIDPKISEYMRANGKKGGKNRAKKYSKKQLLAWSKMGGRPKKKIGTEELSTTILTAKI